MGACSQGECLVARSAWSGSELPEGLQLPHACGFITFGINEYEGRVGKSCSARF